MRDLCAIGRTHTGVTIPNRLNWVDPCPAPATVALNDNEVGTVELCAAHGEFLTQIYVRINPIAERR